VPARNGCASRREVWGPTLGAVVERWGGKKLTGTPSSAKMRASWPSTTSGSVPTTRSDRAAEGADSGSVSASAARQASSPCVKVVSMPLPEYASTRTAGANRAASLSAERERSSLITSDGHEPTRNRSLMFGRRSRSRATVRSSSSFASARPAKSFSSRMAVAKRGSAKIITPAADWSRCAQVREPTTKKNAS
jgi:hypothetical protein